MIGSDEWLLANNSNRENLPDLALVACVAKHPHFASAPGSVTLLFLIYTLRRGKGLTRIPYPNDSWSRASTVGVPRPPTWLVSMIDGQKEGGREERGKQSSEDYCEVHVE